MIVEIEDLEGLKMKKRIISALVAVLICAPFLYFGGMPLYVLALVIGLLGYREWLNLITQNKVLRMMGYFIFVIIIASNLYKTSFVSLLDYRMLGLILLLMACISLLQYKNKEIKFPTYFYVLGMTLLLACSFSAMIIIRNMSLAYFLFLISITILNDVFAHLIGTMWGCHPLSDISPHKTLEGSLGGLCFGVVGSSILFLILINSEITLFFLVIITIFLSIISQLGDLFFSQIKRYYKIKDFGNIMPGHGGILDRLDSFIFVALAFTFLFPFL